MDMFIESTHNLAGLLSLDVRAAEDTTGVTLESISENYYYGKYRLPLEISLGEKGIAVVIIRGKTTSAKTVQDTTSFAYGRFGQDGGKIAVDSMSLEVPKGALSQPEFITVVPVSHNNKVAAKAISGEIMFDDTSYSIGPSSLHADIPLDVEFSVSSRSHGAGVYRRTGYGWEFAGALDAHGAVRAEIHSAGEFRLGFDCVPPQVGLLDSDESAVSIVAEDYGSGIDISTLMVTYDGHEISWSYDVDNSESIIRLSDFEHGGDVVIEVSIADRSGNETVKSLSVNVDAIPGQIFVEQNFPNPFNPLTTISFVLTSENKVNIKVYDQLGRRVRVLVNDNYPEGRHSVV